MSYVATLVSDPEQPAVTEQIALKAAQFLPSGRVGAWLNPGIAVDIAFRPEGSSKDSGRSVERRILAELAAQFRAEISDAPVDIILQPESHRRKKLFVADMDSTMIAQECIDELADFAGLKDPVAAITERAMRGEIAFEPALRERVALLKGLPTSVIDDVLRERIRLTPGARTLVATMRAHGAHTCLVSGGFSAFVERVSGMIGFDESRSNTLLADAEGKLSGLVGEPILGREAKLGALVELKEKLRLDLRDTMAVGDGANDLAMIEEAGLGVAFHAKPKVAEAAAARIDQGDLTALLYVQGYSRAEFVYDPRASSRF